MTTPAFSQCVACSSNILREYRQRGVEMVIEACNSPDMLSKLSGIFDRLQADVEVLEVEAGSDLGSDDEEGWGIIE